MATTARATTADLDPVVVEGLTKSYPNGVTAVQGISFRVRCGEVFGLLGPNGAGKTTTIGVLTTLVRPSSGTALVGGHDVIVDPLAARRSIGVVFQDSVLDNEFSGEANLWLHARLWRVPEAGARIASLLAAVELSDRAADSVRAYSGGMRRRLEIARALLARPSVLFLDEPTLGLDPIGRQELWHTIGVLREREQVTVLLSTHYLEEAETVCDRVAIIDRGQIIALDSPSRLIERVGGQMLDLRVDGDPADLLAALRGLGPSLGEPILGSSTVSVASTDSPEVLSDRANGLMSSRHGVRTMTVRPTTLNDVFLILTARRANDGETTATVAAGVPQRRPAALRTHGRLRIRPPRHLGPALHPGHGPAQHVRAPRLRDPHRQPRATRLQASHARVAGRASHRRWTGSAARAASTPACGAIRQRRKCRGRLLLAHKVCARYRELRLRDRRSFRCRALSPRV